MRAVARHDSVFFPPTILWIAAALAVRSDVEGNDDEVSWEPRSAPSPASAHAPAAFSFSHGHAFFLPSFLTCASLSLSLSLSTFLIISSNPVGWFSARS